MLAKRIAITVYPQKLEILRKRAKNQGLPLSRYVVMKALSKLKEE